MPRNYKINKVKGRIFDALFIIFAIAVAMFVWKGVPYLHEKYHCEAKTRADGKCGWSWCKYYDHSDPLHDQYIYPRKD